MKLFKKLMAGAMAIAMLSAYTVAFAGSVTSGITSNSGATVSGAGSYAGSASPVFLMTLPTAAANNSLAFTVDPQRIIEHSPPANSVTSGAGQSTYGTVIFSTVSGSATQNTTYSDTSAPLKVTSMSSVDVTVNMLATLTDTKMKLSTTSGFSAAKEHLYLAVNVTTTSGGTTTLPISALGAKNATTLATVPSNFKTAVVSGGAVETTVSGATANTPAENIRAAGALDPDSWSTVEYTVTGASNPAADWQIEQIAAPNLTIKWDVVPANELTYDVTDPVDSASPKTYTAQLDKNAYKSGETVTVYVQPVSSTAKLKSVTFKYISLKADGTMDKEVSVKAQVVGTVNDAGTTVPTAINGAYQAYFTFPNPSTMAKIGALPGATITSFTAPKFDIVVA